jgi:type IV pilus assembly protein PilW
MTDMTLSLLPKHGRREFQTGFSLIELMIAITLGLMILAGLTTIFVKNSQARSEIERSNRQLESGRYAISLLSEDLRMAGFLGQFDPKEWIMKDNNPPLGDGLGTATMTTMPDPCATSVDELKAAFFFPVQGYDESATIPSCLVGKGAIDKSDILVIRRVSTCVAGPAGSPTLDADCAVVSGAPYFQTSNCYQPAELARRLDVEDYKWFFSLDTVLTALDRRPLSCAAGAQADYRRYLTHIYFVADNNVAGDGIPTLKRAELGAGSFTIVPLVEGIETIQFEYGVGGSINSAAISAYTPDPANGCAGTDCVYNWLLVYSVKVNLLARNVEKSPGHTDTKTYTLGEKLPGPTSYVFGPFNDAYKRHAYNATVRLDNPSGRATP